MHLHLHILVSMYIPSLTSTDTVGRRTHGLDTHVTQRHMSHPVAIAPPQVWRSKSLCFFVWHNPCHFRHKQQHQAGVPPTTTKQRYNNTHHKAAIITILSVNRTSIHSTACYSHLSSLSLASFTGLRSGQVSGISPHLSPLHQTSRR